MEFFETDNAYQTAMEFLLAGKMPVIVQYEDNTHVLAISPTDRSTLGWMLHPDERVRLKFIVSAMVSIKENVEEAYAAD